MSLPYHDERRPEGMKRPWPLVGPNLGLTIRANQQCVLDAMDAISVLRQLGHEHVVVLGFSLGSGVSVLLDAHDPRPAAVLSILCANSFADCVWNGISTVALRRELEPHLDLATLRRVWRPMEFGHFVPRLRSMNRVARHLVVGDSDQTFPAANARILRAIYRAHSIPHEWTSFGCGHYTLAYPPYSWRFGLWLRKQLADLAARLPAG